MAFSRDVLNLNETSDDFNYQLINTYRSKAVQAEQPKVLPRRVSVSQTGLNIKTTLFVPLARDIILNLFYGYYYMFNDPYELPSTNSKIVPVSSDRFVSVTIDAQINTMDESIASYEPDE